MPADSTLLPTLGNTTITQIPFEYNETHAKLVILQNALKSVINSQEVREADPPMLDTLDALIDRFKDLLERY